MLKAFPERAKEMSTLLNDLKYGIRMLAKNPGLTLVIVFVLSLGISVSVAMFGLMDGLSHPPSSFVDPNRIVHVRAKSIRTRVFSYLDCLALREQLTSLSGLATIDSGGRVLKKDGWSRKYETAKVSRNFFTVAQVKAHLGYVFSEDDGKELKDQPSVVLSHRLWKSHFGSDPEIIGRSILLNNVNRIVLGVVPQGFRFRIDQDSSIDFWIPVDSWDKKENYAFQSMIGRLKSGAAIRTLQMETEAAFSSLNLRDHETQTQLKPLIVSDRDQRHIRHNPAETIFLLGITDIVLLIACLNVSGLLLAKANSRRREMAVRQAMGGSRGRLMRQLFTEGILLAMLALGISILMAYWFLSLVRSRLPVEIAEHLAINIFNPRVVVFSLSIALGGTLLFEFLPTLYTCKMDLVTALKADRSRCSRLGRRLFGLPVMVTMQLAFSLILTVCAGHFLRSYLGAKSMDLGFRNRNVLLAYNLDSNREMDQCKTFFRDLVAKVKTLTGVENVGLALHLPTPDGWNRREYRIFLPNDEIQTDNQGKTIQASIVDPGYFPTMGISVLAGHNFSEQLNPSDARQVIVSQAFASRFWPGKDPVGRFIQLEDLDDDNPIRELAQVIGMVSDVRGYPVVHRAPDPFLYISFGQVPSNNMTLLVETLGNPRLLADPVRKIIQHLDHTVDVYTMATLAQGVKDLMADYVFFTQLIGSLSLFGLSLACVGLYGIIAFTVTRRTYELGVRMALGARSRDVMHIVMSQGLKLSLVGLGIGLVGSVALIRVFKSLLYEIISFDLVVFGISSVVILLAAMLATYKPARRAAKIDPMEALKYE